MGSDHAHGHLRKEYCSLADPEHILDCQNERPERPNAGRYQVRSAAMAAPSRARKD
jgi:hypothetical protein